jgi:hypothetical protein
MASEETRFILDHKAGQSIETGRCTILTRGLIFDKGTFADEETEARLRDWAVSPDPAWRLPTKA